MSANSLAHTGDMPSSCRSPVPPGQLPSVPESVLPTGLQLPACTPPPPWRCRVEAVVWWHRAALGAAALLPPGLRPGPPLAVGALLRYLDSPVGTYDEVLGCPHLLHRVRLHVPFIAVDSLASLAGGRAHWSLPKTLAGFTRTGGQVRAEGTTARDWSVAATPGAVGPWLPLVGAAVDTQVDADGQQSSSTTRAAVLGRFARVEVDSSAGLAPWLLPGRHRGVVLRGRVVVGPARPRRA